MYRYTTQLSSSLSGHLESMCIVTFLSFTLVLLQVVQIKKVKEVRLLIFRHLRTSLMFKTKVDRTRLLPAEYPAQTRGRTSSRRCSIYRGRSNSLLEVPLVVCFLILMLLGTLTNTPAAESESKGGTNRYFLWRKATLPCTDLMTTAMSLHQSHALWFFVLETGPLRLWKVKAGTPALLTPTWHRCGKQHCFLDPTLCLICPGSFQLQAILSNLQETQETFFV